MPASRTDAELVETFRALLSRFREAHGRRNVRGLPPESVIQSLAELRDAADALREWIHSACAEGRTVSLYTPHGSHRKHEVRTVGPLLRDVILCYSPQREAASCDYHCILTDVERADVTLTA